MSQVIRRVEELRVFQNAMDAAMEIFEFTSGFPAEERYSLTSQIRRSSRSVCANLAEAWRKRYYKAHFLSKLSDCTAEAEETRVWLRFALRCRYLSERNHISMDKKYDRIIAQLVSIMSKPENWTIK